MSKSELNKTKETVKSKELGRNGGAGYRLCAVRRTGPFSLAGVSGAPRRAGSAVRNGNDADVVYYLNRTRLPVIGTES